MNNEANHGGGPEPPHSTHDTEHAPELPPLSPRIAVAGIVLMFLVAVGVALLLIFPRLHAAAELKRSTEQMAPPDVVAAHPRPGAPANEITLPGNIYAYTDSPIYARTNGYLTHWYYDIGAHVKKGALLAIISTPEVDQQLMQAQADLATAQANAGNARINADRYQSLVKSDSVSQQDTDTFTTQANATSAAVKSAQANVQRLRELQSFERIYAPFDGLVTARNIDVGQLIDQGTNRELFHMQAVDTLRVYVNIPQPYSQGVKPGMHATLTFAEMPGRRFDGVLVRTARAIDPVSRTLPVEVDVNNRAGELFPGAYTQVHFSVRRVENVVVLPVSAILFRQEGVQVATLDAGNRVRLVHVAVGEDDGRAIQVLSGLSVSDRVITDPPDSIIDGELVNVVKASHDEAQSSEQRSRSLPPASGQSPSRPGEGSGR